MYRAVRRKGGLRTASTVRRGSIAPTEYARSHGELGATGLRGGLIALDPLNLNQVMLAQGCRRSTTFRPPSAPAEGVFVSGGESHDD
jgi:hypothetical protein